MSEDKLFKTEELKTLVKESEIKYSDLIVAKDNVQEALTLKLTWLLTCYTLFEKDAEKVDAFRKELIDVVRISSEAGMLKMLIECMEENNDERTVND
jgi:hypothetical protein